MAARPALVLYHAVGCRSSRVLWMYLELRRAYEDVVPSPVPALRIMEFRDKVAWKEKKPDWYLKLNPNGKVPTFVDPAEEAVIFESGAIATYLLETFDPEGRLLPKKASERAFYHQLAFYCAGTVDNLVAGSSPIQHAKRLAGDAGYGAPEWENPANRLAWDEYVSSFFENQLKKTGGPFLLGAKFSAADVVFGHCLQNLHDKLLQLTGSSWVDPSKTPLLAEYAVRLRERPARQVVYKPPVEWAAAAGLSAEEAAAP